MGCSQCIAFRGGKKTHLDLRSFRPDFAAMKNQAWYSYRTWLDTGFEPAKNSICLWNCAVR